MTRTTIKDVALAAGVSKGAASHALNGKPGVSETTRARVKAAAEQLGWRPDFAARALTGASTGAVGLAIARPPEVVGAEHFFMSLLAGMEEELSHRGLALMIQMVPDLAAEVALLEKWSAERRVDGILLIDARVEDPRIPVIERLRIPAAGISVAPLSPSIATIVCDEAARVDAVLGHLLAAGHRRLAYLSGSEEFLHARRRGELFAQCCEAVGAQGSTVPTDYSSRDARAWVRGMLELPRSRRPTAVVVDNDLLAVRLLGELAEAGVRVPEDLALVSFEDSLLCTLATPQVTALRRDVTEQGRRTVALLAACIDGEVRDEAARGDALMVRRSTDASALAADPAA